MFRSLSKTVAAASSRQVLHTAPSSAAARQMSMWTVRAAAGVCAPQQQQQKQKQFGQVRFYSHAPPLTKDIIQDRIVELLEAYSKTPDVEITSETSLAKSLGFDSFDQAEVICELEYEFSILVDDDTAAELKTVGQMVDYIAEQPDAC